jgi:pyruvate/2-oxoglutarate dehydrogenase complex dihydrolipoamide acyltransferase (E2) component
MAPEVTPFPKSRRLIVDTGRAARSRHSVHGLLEIDVTEARRLLAASDPRPTLTAWVVGCVARAAAEDPGVHAYRDLRNRLVTFDSVDVNVSVEVSIEGRSFPMNHVLRGADGRTATDLSAELRDVKRSPGRSPTAGMQRWARRFLLLPGAARVLLLRLIHRMPRTQRRLVGTVGVTSVGMFGDGGGWGIAFQVHTLDVVVGGIATRPGYSGDGSAEPREHLHLTLSFDHDVVDGAPAARFAARLRDLMEAAAGLGAEDPDDLAAERLADNGFTG